jgi:fatty-acid desaturase
LNREAAVTNDERDRTRDVPSSPPTAQAGPMPRFEESEARGAQPADSPAAAPPPTTRFRDRFPNGINWATAIWMAGMHAGAIAALWHFSWQALVVFLVLHFVCACLGITLGYHRLLTHGSFVVHPALRYFFSMCGMLTAEGSPIFWVATHRKHHAHSDQEGDPHTPNDGFWWSHMLWFQPKETEAEKQELFARWAPDLYKDPVHRFFDRTFFLFSLALGGVLYVIGERFFGLGLSFLLWGLCARIVVCYHCTWFVNSATHVWGYRNYQTGDRSTNLWWVALLTYGEGWHNNHHAHQRLARHGHRWWEIDITYMVIWTLEKLGLAKSVQDKLPES